MKKSITTILLFVSLGLFSQQQAAYTAAWPADWIHIEVTPVPFEKLSDEKNGESSIEIRKRVTKARELQTKRFEGADVVHYNAQMNTKHIRKHCKLDEESM